MTKTRLSKPMDKEFFRRTETMRGKLITQANRIDQFKKDYAVLQALSDYRETVIIDLRRQLDEKGKIKWIG